MTQSHTHDIKQPHTHALCTCAHMYTLQSSHKSPPVWPMTGYCTVQCSAMYDSTVQHHPVYTHACQQGVWACGVPSIVAVLCRSAAVPLDVSRDSTVPSTQSAVPGPAQSDDSSPVWWLQPSLMTPAQSDDSSPVSDYSCSDTGQSNHLIPK